MTASFEASNRRTPKYGWFSGAESAAWVSNRIARLRRPGIAARGPLGFCVPDGEGWNPRLCRLTHLSAESTRIPSGFVGIPGRSLRWMGRAIGS